MYDTLFSVLFLLVLPSWAAMILAPGWRYTEKLVATPLIAAPPALIYAVLVLADLDTVYPAVMSNDPSGVAELLGTPAGATIAWAHFLALDLLAGRWIYRELRDRGRPVWVSAPVLLLTLLFAPLGVLAHLAIRHVGTSTPAAVGQRAGT